MTAIAADPVHQQMPSRSSSTKEKSSRSKKKSSAKKKKTVRRAAAKRAPEPSGSNEWFELRRSPIQGLGAFARKDIPKDTRIIEYVGEKISWAESDRRYDDEDMDRHHTFLFTLNSRVVVDAAVDGNDARFINHSCDPNCEAIIERGRIWIDAKQDIAEGAELLYDYQYEWDSDYTKDDLLFYACRCGTKKCRGTIVKAPKRKLRQWGFIK